MITTQSELISLAKDLLNQSAIGIDTEFDWRNTYFPTLCLIQVATKTDIYLIDPLIIDDLSALKPVLENTKIVKILHSPTYDLKILNQHTGAKTANLFDTQLAAEFLGFNYQPSLNDLLMWLKSIELDKSVKLSNWTARPLTEQQLKYAKEDVKYLIDAHDQLIAKLDQINRLQWFLDEINSRFDDTFYQPINTEAAYLKLKRHKSFQNSQFENLKALATWRENTAIEKNVPLRRIIDDHSIYQIVTTPPTDTTQLRDRYYQLHKSQFHNYGESILNLLKNTNTDSSNTSFPYSRENNSSKSKSLNDELFQEIYDFFKNFCTEQQIISQMVATRLDLKLFVLFPDNSRHKLNQGWRYNFVGKELLKRFKL